MSTRSRKRKKDLQVRWLERFITPSYAPKTGIDKQRIKSEDVRTDNRALAETVNPHVTKVSGGGISDGLGLPSDQHVLGHVDCPACLRTKLMMTESAISPTLLFADASQEWIERMTFQGHRGTYVSPRSIDDFRQYRRALNKTFEKIPLDKIHLGHLGTYQVERSKDAGPNRITQELGMLIRIMKAAGLWTAELDQRYRPLKHEEPDIPRALSPAQQKHWLETTSSVESLRFIYCYSLAAIRTTARTCEMQKLRLGDLVLDTGLFYIRRTSAKTPGSLRTIALTDDAVWAFRWLIGVANSKGSTDPQHHLFPFRICRGEWDPNRPMTPSALKKPWNEARAATGIDWFDPYGLRHTGITRLAEVGTPMAVIMARSGQLTTKMVQHYTAISEQAQRMWTGLALQAEQRKPPARQMWKSGIAVEVSS